MGARPASVQTARVEMATIQRIAHEHLHSFFAGMLEAPSTDSNSGAMPTASFADAIVGFGPSRQQQQHKHVVKASLRAAHDVVARCAASYLYRSDGALAECLYEHADECGAAKHVELVFHLHARVALDGLRGRCVTFRCGVRAPSRFGSVEPSR